MKKDINGFVKSHSSVIVETLIYGGQTKVMVYSTLLKKWRIVTKERAIRVFENHDTYFQVWADNEVIKIA